MNKVALWLFVGLLVTGVSGLNAYCRGAEGQSPTECAANGGTWGGIAMS